MDSFAQFIPLIKILVAFSAMLAGIRLRLGLGTSILAGTALTGLLFGLPLGRWPGTVFDALTNEKTLFLDGIVAFIMLFSGLLEKTGQSTRLMEALTAYLRKPRLRLVFFPALIGLLPMPGGAVFSAPMVDEMAKDLGVTGKDKVLVNYWYRHIWELAWPLYPGIILSASLADIPMHALILRTMPAVPLMLLLGWFFVLRPLRTTPAAAPADAPRGDWRKAARLGLPLIIAIAGAVGLEMGIGFFAPDVPFEWGVLLALAGGIVCIMVQNGAPARLVGDIVFSRHLGSMLYVVVAIFVYKEFMQASGVVAQLAGLGDGEMALVVASVFLPFLVGVIAGINVAFVGATFPIMLGLLHQMGMDAQILPYVVLGQFSGFAGVMFSPLHICFLLTCQFFHVEIADAWRKTAVPSVVVLLAGICWFFVIS